MILSFGATRLVTSFARWVIALFQFVFSVVTTGKGNLLLTPPIAKRQLVLSKEAAWKMVSLNIGSYADWASCHEIFVRREYALERFEHGKVLQMALNQDDCPTPTVIDLGANIGIASVFFQLALPHASTISVEPSPKNCELIEKNVLKPRVNTILQAAIGSQSGHVNLYDSGGGNNAFSTMVTSDKVIGRVRQITMAEILADLDKQSPLIVKVDIEGAERELFQNNLDWVDEASLIIIEIHDWLHPGQAISNSLLTAMAKSDFDLVFHGENLFFFRNKVPNLNY